MAKKIEIKIIGDSSSVERAFARAGASANRFGSGARKAAAVSAAAGAAILTLGGFAAKAAIDFESSFAGVRKTVNASESELNKLASGFLALSKRIPVNVNELNRIGEAAGQLGVQKKSILKFTETIAKLGVATNLAGEEGATMLARFANVTRMPQRDFDRLGATIVALGNAGASTESEIAAMALRLGAAGTQVGMTQAEILGFANALSSVGIEAEAGGSAVSTAMITIAKAVQGGGEKLSTFASVAGMSAEDFAKKWKKNPSAALIDFVEGLDRVKKEGGNVFETLDKLGLGGIRVRDALLRSAGAGDLMRKSLELGNKAWKENVALNKEAEQRFKTTASQLQLLKNNVSAYAIVWGAKLLPAINAAILMAGEFVRKFGEAKGMEAKLRVVWTGLESAGAALQQKIGDAIAAVDWVAVWARATGIGEGIKARFESIDWTDVGRAMGDGIADAVATAAGPSKKLAQAFAQMTRSVDWVALGSAMGPGLAAALVVAFTTLLDPGFWIKNWDLALAVALVVFGRGIGKLVAPIGRLITTSLGEAWASSILAITGWLEKQGMPRIASAVLGGLARIPGLVSALLGKLRGIVSAGFGKLGKLTRIAVKVVGIQAAINAIVQFGKAVIQKIKDIVSDAYSAGKEVGAAIADGMTFGLASKAKALAAKAADVARDAYNAAKHFLGIGSPSKLFADGIGKPIGDGIALGIARSAPSALAAITSMTRALAAASLTEVNALQAKLNAITGRREAEDRATAVRQAETALAAARKKGEGVAEAERQLARAREDIVVAGLNRQLAKEQAIYDRRQAMVEAKMAKLNAAVQKAMDKAQTAFDRMQSKILSAFDATRGGIVTPAEAALAALDESRRERDLQRALADAIESGDQEAILRAQEDIQRASLERQAANERRALDQQTDAMREKLENRLAAMATAWKGGTDNILSLLDGYGIDFANVGALLGDAFRESLLAAITGSSNAAKALGKAKGNATAGAKAVKIPALATGGSITGSGLAFVHRGETVMPAGVRSRATSYTFAPVINLPRYLGESRRVAEEIRTELMKLGRDNGSIFGGLA